MLDSQRAHIEAVIEWVGAAPSTQPASPPAPRVIRESWTRCVEQHRLDPARMQAPIIVPRQALREHRDQLEEFLAIARHGLEVIHRQVGGLGYCVLLANARGITVDYLGERALAPHLRRSGLYLGSDWNEELAGTCAIGTAIATGEALTVHQTDHFDATHIPLTCSAAPIFDPLGRLTAVLDISALTSPEARTSQHLALQLVRHSAHQVESASFLRWFRGDWVLKLHPSPAFVEISPDYLVALDPAGRIIGHNHAARQRLEAIHGGKVLGLSFEVLADVRIDDLGRHGRAMPGERRSIMLGDGQTRLYLHAIAPPSRVEAALVDAAERPGGRLAAAREGRPRGIGQAGPMAGGGGAAGAGGSATDAAAAGSAAGTGGAALPASLAALSAGDPRLDQQLARAARLAATDVSLLVTGETGSGKEYFARAVHAASPRRDRPFVAVNCAAIPETLIESELFGHLPGAFSGASPRGKRGLVHEADGGTLFLDEIGDMPIAMQARLLRVLAEREVLPIGATQPQRVDIRVLAATHADLAERCRAGQFRDDLYYRLAGAHLNLPPLRERRDLAWLIGRFLADRDPAVTLGPDAERRLLAYRWPGNLRELANAIDFGCAMAGPGGIIGVADLPEPLIMATEEATGAPCSRGTGSRSMPTPPPGRGPEPGIPGTGAAHRPGAIDATGADVATPPRSLDPEALLLLQYLRAARWNITTVAHQLGIARMTVYRRMKRWGIRAPH